MDNTIQASSAMLGVCGNVGTTSHAHAVQVPGLFERQIVYYAIISRLTYAACVFISPS